MGRRERTHLALLRPLVPQPKSNEITLSHDVLERLPGVGNGRSISLEVIDELLRVRDADIGRCLAMTHKVSGEKLPNGVEVLGVQRFAEAIRKRLVLFLWRASRLGASCDG